MRRFLTTCILGFYALSMMAVYTPQTVPNPRVSGSYVANPDQIISIETVQSLNQILAHLEQQTEVQMAVVALSSIGDEDYTDFSYQLATTWGIGRKDKNTGLLILLVLDQRAVRIEVGNGLEGLLPDAVCERILQDEIFPSFQNADYNQGFLNGTKAIYSHLTTDEAKAELLLEREYAPRRILIDILTYYLIISFLLLIVVAWCGWYTMNAQPKAANNIRYAQTRNYVNTCWVLALFFPIPLLAWAIYIRQKHKQIRFNPVICPECKHAMTLLSENEEDKHLNKKQQKEEQLRSVNYDVWECKHCYNHIILPYHAQKTPYSECRYCHAIASCLHADVILTQPTQFYNGLGERTYICQHCGKQFVSTYVIPKLPVVVTGGSGNGGGFSGGSWGGGGFSGGGAGGHF